MTSQPPVIVCDPTALTAEEREHHITNSYEVFAAVQEARALPDGYAFRLPEVSSILPKLADFITYDRLCCSHLRYEVMVEQQSGPIWLHLTGPEGVKEFLAAVLVDLLPPEVVNASDFCALNKN